MAPPTARSYSQPDDFRTLKKHIFSNAHAYFSHRLPKAERYGLITASTTTNKSFDDMKWRAALIVFPNSDGRD